MDPFLSTYKLSSAINLPLKSTSSRMSGKLGIDMPTMRYLMMK
jgi:hypothetical protein